MDIANGTRASDAERAHAAELLGRHVADGRLDLAEYERRVAHIYAAQTRADLDRTLDDLPAIAPAPRPRPQVPLWQRIELTAWAGVSLLNVAIWGVVSLGIGALVYPWPIWVAGPWGVVLLMRVLSGAESGRRGITGCRGAAQPS